MIKDPKEIELPSGKVQPRSANHPDCKHEWRYLKDLTEEHQMFYCIHCLLYTIKINDFTKEQVLQMQKEYDEQKSQNQK